MIKKLAFSFFAVLAALPIWGNGFVTPLNSHKYASALSRNIIALWQSHGCYYNLEQQRWIWQRCRLFGQVEDLYTQSYVLPYLVPMLENAGAYVMLPRERDFSSVEVIVDNDGQFAQPGYHEISGKHKWSPVEYGFGYTKEILADFENPFSMGTARMVETVTKKNDKPSMAKWSAEIPENGEFAVYISYKTLEKSVSDAVFSINAADGVHSFKVNQKMGGGLWIYLGTFPFNKGQNPDIVSLSNRSAEKGVITADAIKIGGGMGNVARNGEPSQRPRFCEAARYFLQWSGFPQSVYSKSVGTNDYIDDYKCRPHWVNYLLGGSKTLPDSAGVNIPVNLALAFHSDAGVPDSTEVIGTLPIVYTKFNNGKFLNGSSRSLSIKLANCITDQVVADIKKAWNPNWSYRPLRDRTYYEARVPEVPTLLLEILSHQSFNDMKYGLDPRFKFSVSRSVYKGMLKFLAERENRKFVVQPLPVQSFAITGENGSFKLHWRAQRDSLTAGGALPTKYLVQHRSQGNTWWEDLKETKHPELDINVSDNKIHSYRVIAINDGGKSFPSEILSLGVAKNSSGNVLVINGFDRVSGPECFDDNDKAGFAGRDIIGVPYLRDFSYTGAQIDFDKSHEYVSDEQPGFGWCRANYETKILAGNSFDYPAIHGDAIMKAGFSFVSSSRAAVECGSVNLNDYDFIDLILGKQKTTATGQGFFPAQFKAITPSLLSLIDSYRNDGGNVIVSGCYVASDLADNYERDEVGRILGYRLAAKNAAIGGEVISIASPYSVSGLKIRYNVGLNSICYAADEVDAIAPAAGQDAKIIMRYSENTLPAAITHVRGNSKASVLAFPIEAVTNPKSRADLFRALLSK